MRRNLLLEGRTNFWFTEGKERFRQEVRDFLKKELPQIGLHLILSGETGVRRRSAIMIFSVNCEIRSG